VGVCSSRMDPGAPHHRDELAVVPFGSLAGAGVVYTIDAFVLNQGALAVVVALAFLVALVPAVIVGALRRDWTKARRGILRGGIFAVAAVAVLGTNALQNEVARRRAEVVIDACERYRVMNGRYPEKLGDLVPGLLPSEPRAKYVLVFGSFDYQAHPDRHTLGYVALPPFGRPYYVLEERRWGYLD
jgi:hypothetical protein